MSQGVELRGVVVTILSLHGIPEFADIENLFYAVVGEITSTLPSTGAGVREYCHDSYNGCYSKVEVNDFRRFLGYVLTDGYNWI